MTEGSIRCLASSTFENGQTPEQLGQGQEIPALREMQDYAATMGKTLALVHGFPMCAVLLLAKARFPDEMPEAACTNIRDATPRACPVMRRRMGWL